MDTETTPAEPATDLVEPPAPKPDPIPVFADTIDVGQLPPFAVVGSNFVASTEQGKLVIPMFLPTGVVRDMPDRLSLLEQCYFILEKPVTEHLDLLDFGEAQVLARKFFQAYEEKQQARLGESVSSSN